MFVRLKDPDGNNVTLIAHKISGLHEGETYEKPQAAGEAATTAETEASAYDVVKVTRVIMDNGMSYGVVESERAIRSKILKAGQEETAE